MASVFDLGRFRQLAFGNGPLPDHPLQSSEDAQELLRELPAGDPDGALAQLTAVARSMNETDSFVPARRARVLMVLDDAARPFWRDLGWLYLTAGGKPNERRDGNKAILRALYDSASEFNNGFALVLDAEERPDWVKKNLALIYVRNMRWLTRRLALAHMLQLSAVSAIWERMHMRLQGAEREEVGRTVVPAFTGNRLPSSLRMEYVRGLLLELGLPESLRARQVELLYRIAGRVASTVQLEPVRSDASAFAVVPAGDSRPVAAGKIGPGAVVAPLYIDTANSLPKLRAMRERDIGRDPAEADVLFRGEFTIRERIAMMDRLLEHWGMDPPQRRTPRVTLAMSARIVCGYDNVVPVIPPFDAGQQIRKRGKEVDLQLMIDSTTQSLKRSQLRAARQGVARVIDASNGGLGLAIKRTDAPWAAHGALVSVVIEPGKTWLVGILRRIFAIEDELRLGIQVLSTKPSILILSTETVKTDATWEEATMFEATFNERFRRAILLEPQTASLHAADCLLPPSLASRNTQFDVPLGAASQRIRVTRVIEDNEHYQRVAFEPLGPTVREGMMP